MLGGEGVQPPDELTVPGEFELRVDQHLGALQARLGQPGHEPLDDRPVGQVAEHRAAPHLQCVLEAGARLLIAPVPYVVPAPSDEPQERLVVQLVRAAAQDVPGRPGHDRAAGPAAAVQELSQLETYTWMPAVARRGTRSPQISVMSCSVATT